MTKAEFVAAYKLALPKAFTSKAMAEEAYDTFCHILATAMQKKDPVRLTGVGSFTIVKRAPRKGRNPRTGKIIDIPARKAIKFNPARSLAERLK